MNIVSSGHSKPLANPTIDLGVHKHTQTPITTGTSVLGVTFQDGVIIAADQLGSYGSMARFRGIPRVSRVNNSAVVGCGGDYADYQFLSKTIEQKMIDEEAANDGHQLTPKALYSWLTRIHYNKRSKFDPLWLNWIVGGLNQDGKPFLGAVDKLGLAYENPVIATGFGAHLALPLMRQWIETGQPQKTEQEARTLIEECLTVLYYRDARSWPKYDIAVVNRDGSRIEGPFEVKGNWNVAHYVHGYE